MVPQSPPERNARACPGGQARWRRCGRCWQRSAVWTIGKAPPWLVW